MDPVRYSYDFGDDWKHALEFENVLASDGRAYPRCVAGAGACPPEDVDGARGYSEFLVAIQEADHPEHREMLDWVGGSFDPRAFAPADVGFDDPKKRWHNAFGRGNEPV